MQRYVLLLALAALAACTQKSTPPQAQTAPAQEAPAAPAAEPGGPALEEGSRSRRTFRPGAQVDKAHTTLLFRVSHMGFSNFTARFRRVDAQLHFDPRNVMVTQLTATVDAHSIETDYPDPSYDFNGELQGEPWLNAAKFPEITFRTTQVEDLGNNALRVHGELTMRGLTKPIVLDATYNGGYLKHPMDPQARVGFSAHGVLRRSDFGIAGDIRLRAATWVSATRWPSSSSRN